MIIAGSIVGPGITLFIFKAPSKAAAGGEPGIPNTSSGMRAPPIAALLAASAEIKPSTDPLPKLALSFEVVFPTP